MVSQGMRPRTSRLLALAALAVSVVSAALLQAGAGMIDPHDGPFWLAFLCVLWPLMLGPVTCLCVVIMLLVERQQSRERRAVTLAMAAVALILPWLPQIIALKLWLGPERALRDSSAAVRRRGAESLGDKAGPEVVTALIGALRDPDDDVRLEASVGLWKQGPEATMAVPALLDALDDPVYGVRAWAMAELARIPGTAPLAVPRLMHAMARKEDTRSAMDALYWYGPDAAPAVPALIEALAEPEPFMRRRAARTLGAVGELARPAVPQLRALLHDQNEALRETARTALIEMGESNDLPPSAVDTWPRQPFSSEAWQATPYWFTTSGGGRYVFYRDLMERRLLEGKPAKDITSLLGPPHVKDRYRLVYYLKSSAGEHAATWYLEIPLDPARRVKDVLIRPE